MEADPGVVCSVPVEHGCPVFQLSVWGGTCPAGIGHDTWVWPILTSQCQTVTANKHSSNIVPVGSGRTLWLRNAAPADALDICGVVIRACFESCGQFWWLHYHILKRRDVLWRGAAAIFAAKLPSKIRALRYTNRLTWVCLCAAQVCFGEWLLAKSLSYRIQTWMQKWHELNVYSLVASSLLHLETIKEVLKKTRLEMSRKRVFSYFSMDLLTLNYLKQLIISPNICLVSEMSLTSCQEWKFLHWMFIFS